MLPRPGVPEGDTTSPKSRGLVFLERDIADPNVQRGYRRVGTIGVGLFLGCSEGGVQRVPTSERGGPEARHPGFGLASCSRGLVLPQEDTTGQKSRRLVFPEGDIADPQMSNEATNGLALSVCAIVWASSEQILALFRQRAKKDPRRDTTGPDSRRAPEAWCSRTGILQAQIRTRLSTLLSNTPQTKWCYSGSPYPIFHRGPLRSLTWTTCHILARSST